MNNRKCDRMMTNSCFMEMVQSIIGGPFDFPRGRPRPSGPPRSHNRQKILINRWGAVGKPGRNRGKRFPVTSQRATDTWKLVSIYSVFFFLPLSHSEKLSGKKKSVDNVNSQGHDISINHFRVKEKKVPKIETVIKMSPHTRRKMLKPESNKFLFMTYRSTRSSLNWKFLPRSHDATLKSDGGLITDPGFNSF